jgi:hypothetical protein
MPRAGAAEQNVAMVTRAMKRSTRCAVSADSIAIERPTGSTAFPLAFTSY